MTVIKWDYQKCILCGHCLTACKASCGESYCSFQISIKDCKELFHWQCEWSNCPSVRKNELQQYQIWERPTPQAREVYPCIESCPRQALIAVIESSF